MSGIAAVLACEGEPVEPAEMQCLVECLHSRAPDAQQVWLCDQVGLAYSALNTSVTPESEQQPLTYANRVWLVAYARLDARDALVRKLADAGCAVEDQATDAMLILHAYHAWKKRCVEHLLGDFSFIIWDSIERRLFAARDQLGVRTLFYAWRDHDLLVSNTLSCLQQFPGVNQSLNQRALTDYLVWGYFLDLEDTAYASIKRLPPAHTLTWENDRLVIERYWLPASEALLAYRKADEYVEHFLTLFRAAVADRVRSDKVAIAMSGGLDSTSVAAVAVQQTAYTGSGHPVQGYVNVYRSLIDDDEERFARLVAQYQDIPLEVRPVDGYALFERWHELDLRASEPADRTLAAWSYDQDKAMAAQSRVILTGFGGDPLFLPEPGYLYALIAHRRVRELRQSLVLCWQTGKYKPLYLRTWLRQRYGRPATVATGTRLPAWLNPALNQEYQLAERWNIEEQNILRAHPRRPRLLSELASSFWPAMLGSYDGEHGYAPREARHPFFDLRLLRFMLRIPPTPWCLDKHLLRLAMRTYLPPAVLTRPKRPLSGYPRHPLSTVGATQAMQGLGRVSDRVQRFGDLQQALDIVLEGGHSPAEYDASLRMIALATWLDGNQK